MTINRVVPDMKPKFCVYHGGSHEVKAEMRECARINNNKPLPKEQLAPARKWLAQAPR
jgi:hypothetical protein